jgi:fructose-bisphosphate aldolase class II
MPVITEKAQVVDLYQAAAARQWVLPCFCTENRTTTEAILAAGSEFGHESGIKNVPLIIAMTCNYDQRTQAPNYTHTHRWDVGLKMFLEDLRILTEEGAPYAELQVMVHLDHVQFDLDRELLTWDMGRFSSIMFDASRLPFQENIRLTREFVEQKGDQIVVEGACDEIADASGGHKSELTSAEKAETYWNETGVDLIVANLGTEHRASTMELKYYGDYARRIKERVGTKLVLHGASSVQPRQIRELFDDGICKVNIWATLERDSTPVLFQDMVRNASKVAGGQVVEQLKQDGFLGEACPGAGKAALSHFTTLYRQEIVFAQMKQTAKAYFELWYR